MEWLLFFGLRVSSQAGADVCTRDGSMHPAYQAVYSSALAGGSSTASTSTATPLQVPRLP